MMANTLSSVTSSPMKIGRRPLNGGCAHQFDDAGRLVEARRLDLADAFPRHDLDRRIRQFGPDQRHRLVDRLLRLRRQPVVQRQRVALVLEQNARTEFGDRGQPPFQFLVHRRGMAATASLSVDSRISAPWPPTAGNCSGAKIRSISFSERPLTSASAPEVFSSSRLRVSQARRHPYFARRRRQVEQRAVDIEQDCAFEPAAARVRLPPPSTTL